MPIQKEKKLCPVHKAVDLIGSKWTLLIVHQLCTEKRGFNELLHSIEGINPRALSLRLKDLLAEKLIFKTVDKKTNQIFYALTPQGASLKIIIKQLANWGDSL